MTAPLTARRAPGQITSFGEGRICSEHDCPTHLSRYNATEYCSTHGHDATGSAASHRAKKQMSSGTASTDRARAPR